MTDALRAFENRDDLEKFSPNGLLLFALELRFDIDDLATVGATAITDGPRDRKCDLVYIDKDSRTAVLAQGYFANNDERKNARANKAAELGIAASWVLGNERPEGLGESLQTAADELDQAIEAGEIDSVELWYSHNLPESGNVQDELERAERSARDILKQRYASADINVRGCEIGRETLDDWYSRKESPILVTRDIDVPVSSWFRESGDGWEAVCTSVPAEWLHSLFQEYGDHLFSANVRGYMPRRKSGQNINFGIENTARDEPGRFWAFNNGVTALVQGIVTAYDQLKIRGIAVVNGAQTTGSIAKVDSKLLKDVRVLIRFVQAVDSNLVEDIIRYNNSQNQIKPSDFRSGDPHQKRLREEFKNHIPNSTYLGARRGGPDDRPRRPSNLIPSDTAAQALAAFHQDPGTAYHELRSIWEKDEVYARYFSEHTSAEHIVFCYSLWRTVTETKSRLSSRQDSEQTEDEKEALHFLRKRGALHLLVAAVASAAEVYLGRAVTDRFELSFGKNVSPEDAVVLWMPLVDALLPFADCLLPVFDEGGLRRKEIVDMHIKKFRSMVTSTKKGNADIFDRFRQNVMH